VSVELLERVNLLGTMTVRGDVDRWIVELDAAGSARRLELMSSFDADSPLVELASLVDEYGGMAVLVAVREVGVRLRRERAGLDAD